jgi:acyl carrier protein
MEIDADLRRRLVEVFRRVFEDPVLDEAVSAAVYAPWDSLAHIKLLIAIEREFAFEPGPEDITAMYSDFATIARRLADRVVPSQ